MNALIPTYAPKLLIYNGGTMFFRYSTLLLTSSIFMLGLFACSAAPSAQPVSVPTATLAVVPASPTATFEPMALTVNGAGVTVAEFDAEVEMYSAAQTALGIPLDSTAAANVVADDLVAQLLLAQAARANGFVLDDAALQARIDSLTVRLGGADALEAWKSAHGFDEAAFRSALKRAVESAWMRDTIVASVPATMEQIHLQQILLYNEDTARSFFLQLSGGADFDELALKADPVTRGDLGWTPRGYLLNRTIEDAAFNLTAGEYSEVIATDVGFHILRVLARDEARPLSPDARLALQDQTLKDWIEQERDKADVVFTLR
ncbi:MAG: peptidylprolyl isomerase [Anaerolineales bacterium]|nr:peptidylprolyl isomerase [Anaerolineales bacterium]